jgi:hypothetical protein
MSTPQPPAGWYPDQVNPQLVRWWDGRMWTNHVQPLQQPPAPQQPIQQPVQQQAFAPQQPMQQQVQQPQQAAAGAGPGVGPMFTDQQLQVIQDARAWGIFEKAAYQVIGQGGQLIGSIQQVQAQPEQGRSEHFQVLDPAGAVVFRVSRPLEMKSAHRPRFEVTFPDGRPLGVIESEKLVGRITFGFTVNGVRLAGVKAEGMRNRRFALTDQHDQQFAQYDREPPRGQRDDSYTITRYRPTPEPLGTFVLAGVIVLDAAFFVASVGGPLR